MRTIVVDDKYKWERYVLQRGDRELLARQTNEEDEVQIFFVYATTSPHVPMEILYLNTGELASLPKSHLGKTTVRYAGTAPMAVVEPDQFGNLQVAMTKKSALEVIYNVEKPNGQGTEGKKKIYLCL